MLENVRFHLEEEGSVKDKEGKKVGWVQILRKDKPDNTIHRRLLPRRMSKSSALPSPSLLMFTSTTLSALPTARTGGIRYNYFLLDGGPHVDSRVWPAPWLAYHSRFVQRVSL